MDRIKRGFQSLQWKLTFSYTAVTVGSLLVVVLILGYLLFSTILVPLDILSTTLSPQAWMQIVAGNTPPTWRYVLAQSPVDTEMVSMLLRGGDLQVSYFDLLRIGDLQIRLRTVGEGTVILVDRQGNLLGTSNPDFIAAEMVGRPLDLNILPGLGEPLALALNGEVDAQRLFVTIEPNEQFYFVIPYFDQDQQEVLAAGIIYFEHIPTAQDLPQNMAAVLAWSLLLFLLAAGIVGTIFGALTARGMVTRLERISRITDAWSQGDFSSFIGDPGEDEIGQLSRHLNHVAEQLQQLLRQREEMAVSEERNRLARDLHDSAKQEALAASFHLGAALVLFNQDSEKAKVHVQEAENLIDSVRGELTDLIHELRPPAANGKRFEETIEEYVIEWAHQAGIKATFDGQGSADIPLAVKEAIYRIMQEALANVARHSRAGHVTVELIFQANSAQIVIEDDGQGFETEQEYEGIGLDSMRERARALHGEILIESADAEGTVIQATFPLSQGG